MSAYPRYSIAPHGRQPSLSNPVIASASHQSPAMIARINEKKQELESLIALRDLSANLASQMHDLEEKLKTLADGTEAVACVLSNWQFILRTIAMASTAIPKSKMPDDPFTKTPETADTGFPKSEEGLSMPQTMVRIPAHDPKQPQ